jgi:hypothetical protein
MNDSEQYENLKILLKQVVWDYNFDENELVDIYFGKKTSPTISPKELMAKLLNGYSWHKLIKILGIDLTKNMLTDDVLNCIYPKSYKNNLINARRILSK